MTGAGEHAFPTFNSEGGKFSAIITVIPAFICNKKGCGMFKKVVIWLFIFAFLSSIISPDAVNAMGSSSLSGGTVAVIIVATIAITAGIIYYDYKTRADASNADTEERKITSQLINETVKKNISQSGNLIVFKW